MAEEKERIYTIPLKKKGFKSSNAADVAVRRVKNFLMKHMKVGTDQIWMDESLNHAIWSNGKYRMPNRLRVKAVKFEDGVVEASLPEFEFKKSRREILREEREKKTPILRREEVPEEEAEGAPGTEGYEMVPGPDGEMKLKKKKKSSKKEETEKEEETETTEEKEEEDEEEPAEEEKTEEKTEKKPGEKPDGTVEDKKKQEKKTKSKESKGKTKKKSGKKSETKKTGSSKNKKGNKKEKKSSESDNKSKSGE
ncbi:MAG: 50S ribosomal protein L31e [Candidatus Thermoplasmatota archaeon]